MVEAAQDVLHGVVHLDDSEARRQTHRRQHPLAGAGWVAVLDEAGDVVVAVCFDTRIRP